MHININRLAHYCINSMLIPIRLRANTLMQMAVYYTLWLYPVPLSFLESVFRARVNVAASAAKQDV